MMRKNILNKHFTLITTRHYPYRISKSEVRRRHLGGHKAIIGIGGNIGDTVRRFERLYLYLKRSSKVLVLESTPIFKNPPFGYLDQADFYNSILLIKTSLTPRELLHFLLRTEKRFGRKRSIKDGPRTLDLDIIFYDTVRIDTKKLQIPHPDWMNRDSVLLPLKYLKGRL